jgi:phosphonate transport system substrate-binding protein
MYAKTIKHAAFALCVLLGAISCSISDLDKDGIPKVLKIGVNTSAEDLQVAFREMDPVRIYLERELGIPVKFYRVQGYAPVIEALRAKKIHQGNMSPFPYLIARQKTGVVSLYTLGMPDGKQLSEYQSCILVRKESGIKTMDDLKARASELSLAFVDPASTSGYIAPRYQMSLHGIDPVRDFKSVVFANDHLSTLLTLNSGKVDVSCNTVATVKRLEKEGMLKAENFNFIWISETLPSTAAFIRSDICPAFRKKLQDAYLRIHTDSAAWSSIVESRRVNYFGTVPLESLRYIAVTEDDYIEFEKIVRSTPGVKME